MLDIDWHVKRLSNIHLHRKAFYPPARVPRRAVEETPDGLDYGFDVPNLPRLKEKHPSITASAVIKTAIALIDITRTGHTHALFDHYEAARSTLPYWPSGIRSLPSADGTSLADLDGSDVMGPTMNGFSNIIEVNPEERGIDFMLRLQEEQDEVTDRAHAPWLPIIDKLNALHPGENAGDLVVELQHTQFITWIPGFFGEYEKIKLVQLAIRAILGVVFVAGIGGPQATTYMISLRWDAANYSREETERLIKDVEKAVMWLVDEKNWDAPVGDLLQQMKK
jgi:hypothetical protein